MHRDESDFTSLSHRSIAGSLKNNVLQPMRLNLYIHLSIHLLESKLNVVAER